MNKKRRQGLGLCAFSHVIRVCLIWVWTPSATEFCYENDKLLFQNTDKLREQGWCSGESACLPPMWPAFDSQTRHHLWVEFVVGSRRCSEGFSQGSPAFLPPQKSTPLNYNSIWKQWMKKCHCKFPFILLFIHRLKCFV